MLDAAPRDIAAVRRQLGPLEAPAAGEADVVVRFVDRLTLSGPVRLLGLDEAGFTDDAFLVLRSKHKARARVQIPLERIGSGPELACERGLPAVPLLIPILNLTVLGKGALPLHASAFAYRGTGVVSTGWSKGGKTEALLAFAARGAAYVGDEWVYVSTDGRRVHGIPEPIRLWHWHLAELPEYRSRVGRGDRARLRALRLALSVERLLPAKRPPRSAAARAAGRIVPALKRQLHVDVPPERLFGGPGLGSTSFDLLFFVASREGGEVVVSEIDPEEVARRMVHSLAHERLDFTAYYRKFRFAFPDAASPLVETAEEIERAALSRALSGKPAYAVDHPYPVPLQALYDAMAPYCGA